MKHTDKWISELEGLRNKIDNISLSAKMMDQDFVIHILNNLTEEYNVVLDGMESKLILAYADWNKLMVKYIQAKLNNQFERFDKRETK